MNDAEGRAARVAPRVRVAQTREHVEHDVDRGGGRELAAAQARAPHDRAQVDAAHVLHDDEQRLVGLDEIEGVHDVGVIERRGDLGLAEEQIAEFGARRVLRQELLEHDLLLEAAGPELLADVDGAHAALGEVPLDAVAARGRLLAGVHPRRG